MLRCSRIYHKDDERDSLFSLSQSDVSKPIALEQKRPLVNGISEEHRDIFIYYYDALMVKTNFL